MLFNSYGFIFLFLPITLIGFHFLGRLERHRDLAKAWLVAMSLLFYGAWNPIYLCLIVGSMLFNYAVGSSLGKHSKKSVLIFGIASNLMLLGYYKYANFFVDNLNGALDLGISLESIVLPLAISFFTFQQITFLVDAYRGKTQEYSFLHYSLFVTFFPQLIAGPIVHHHEMMPQFAKKDVYKIRSEHLAIGITIFVIGLFKKVVIADGIAIHASPVFDAAEAGAIPTFFEAWGAALAYTFQLYFDFSGYADMAIGIARMFGLKLPVNFHSPYKAKNIIDFWRFWHMTLSRFLRDYLYIPMGGNRKGGARRYSNLLITMLLGGLWHGAGWTFVLWGGLHGLYLAINNMWLGLCKRIFNRDVSKSTWYGIWSGRVITFTAVILAWVIFRAESLDGALLMYEGMAGFGGLSLPAELSFLDRWLAPLGAVYDGFGEFGSEWGVFKLFFLLVIVWLLPNTQQIMWRYKPALMPKNVKIQPTRFEWQPSAVWSVFFGVIAVMCIINLSKISEFLYFQF